MTTEKDEPQEEMSESDADGYHMKWLKKRYPYAWLLAQRDERIRSGNPENGDVRQATISVRRTMSNVAPELVKDELIEITPFVGAHGMISRSFEHAMKDDNGYQIGKFSVFISVPVYPEEIPQALEVLNTMCRVELRKAFAAARSDAEKKASGRTLPPTK